MQSKKQHCCPPHSVLAHVKLQWWHVMMYEREDVNSHARSGEGQNSYCWACVEAIIKCLLLVSMLPVSMLESQFLYRWSLTLTEICPQTIRSTMTTGTNFPSLAQFRNNLASKPSSVNGTWMKWPGGSGRRVFHDVPTGRFYCRPEQFCRFLWFGLKYFVIFKLVGVCGHPGLVGLSQSSE